MGPATGKYPGELVAGIPSGRIASFLARAKFGARPVAYSYPRVIRTDLVCEHHRAGCHGFFSTSVPFCVPLFNSFSMNT
mgnify:CR=1 FL=1